MRKLARFRPTDRWFMVRRLEAGEAVQVVADGLQVSATTVYRWWRRYRTEGEPRRQDRSTRPHRSPQARPAWHRRLIQRLRERRWSSQRIAGSGVDGGARIGGEYVPVTVDDRTRLAYAEIYPNETAASAAAFLDRVVAWFTRWGCGCGP